MLRQNRKLLVIFTLIASSGLAAIDEDQRLMEELSGVKARPQRTVVATASEIPSLESQRLLLAGRNAFKNRKYISALQNYDRIISLYPQSAELPAAYLAKGQLYLEMGLTGPAELNFKLAEASKKTIK